MSAEVSSDAGVTWTVPVFNVGGAIGANGSRCGKSIVWDAGTDWPRNYSSRMRFRVTAGARLCFNPGRELYNRWDKRGLTAMRHR